MNYRIIPSFIQELLEAGITVELTSDSFLVHGFYNSGVVEVKCQGESDWFATDRYHNVTSIEDVQDLVALNVQWWQSSKDRYVGWNQPDSQWLKLLVQYEYVQAKVVPQQTIYE